MMAVMMALPLLGLVLFYILPFWTALPVYVCLLLVSAVMYYGMFTVMGKKRRVATGFEEMMDREAVVMEDIDPEGKIQIDDEIWDAVARGASLQKGKKVRIRGREGLTLIVEALNKP